LLALCEPVDLVLSEKLCITDEATRFAYFPVNSTISLVTAIDGKPVLEVGMVGREGMVGAELVLGCRRHPCTPWSKVPERHGAFPVGRFAANWRPVPRCGSVWIDTSMCSWHSSARRPHA